MSAMVIPAASLARRKAVSTTAALVVVDEKAQSPVLHLTRRGRFIFFGIPALLVAAAVLFTSMAIAFGSIASPAHASVEIAPVSMSDYATTVTVLQGESLWSIAQDTNPNRSARDVVQEIVALNELGTGSLHAGQQLIVPLPR